MLVWLLASLGLVTAQSGDPQSPASLFLTQYSQDQSPPSDLPLSALLTRLPAPTESVSTGRQSVTETSTAPTAQTRPLVVSGTRMEKFVQF